MGWFSSPIANGLANILAFATTLFLVIQWVDRWKKRHGPGLSYAWQKARLSNLSRDLRQLKRMRSNNTVLWSALAQSICQTMVFVTFVWAVFYFAHGLVQYRSLDFLIHSEEYRHILNDPSLLALHDLVLWYLPMSVFAVASMLLLKETFSKLHEVANYEESRRKILEKYLKLRKKRAAKEMG